MKTVRIICGILLILIAICCAVVLSAKKVPPEEITTTATEPITTASETETTTITTETETSHTEPIYSESERITSEMQYLPSPSLVFDDNEYITPEYFKKMGVISDGKYTYTWYSENVLPGNGLNIPGRHSDGNYVLDENDYIILASSDLPKGTVLDTPFGEGKVYDVCPTSGIIDVYTSF